MIKFFIRKTNNSCGIILLAMLVLPSLVFSQNHSFGYISPVCKNAANPSPTVSSNFVSGGTFLGSSGLSVNGSNGVINLSLTNPGTYTVVYTGAICGCFTNAPVSATVQVLPSPSITVAGANTVCSGSSVSFTASGANSYQWTTGSTNSVTTDFPFNPLTSYTVLGTDANGCTATAVHTVALIQTPTVNIFGSPTVCVGYNYVMTANVTSTSTPGYTWTGSAALTGTGAVVSTSLLTSANFTVLVSAGGCTNEANISVAAIPVPTVSILGSNTICAGTRTTLHAFGAATYTWGTTNIGDSLAVQPNTSTSYTVIGTDINGCSSSAVFVVNVLPVPTVSIIGAPSVCSGKTVALTGSGAASYSWTGGAQTSAINFAPSKDSTIFVTGTNAQGCKNTASVTIFVFPTPTVAVPNATACAGSTVELVAQIQGTLQNGITYLWLPGSASGATFVASPLANTIYTLTASANTCQTRVTTTVSVFPSTLATTAFSYSSPVCNTGGVVYPVLSGSFTSGGTFSYSGSQFSVDPFTGGIDFSNVPEGSYNIQYTVDAQGCRLGGSNTGFVFVKKTEQITFAGNEFTIQPGESATLSVTSDHTGISWLPTTNINCSVCKNVIVNPQESTQYCATSTEGCVQGGCVLVNVVCTREGDFSVPNAFSPNGDGLNDRYCLRGWDECLKSFNVKIFDRWGELLFESDDANFCWDGSFKGDILPSGTYVYVIAAEFDQVPGFRQSGNISLIR